jgi:hypothetical protein
MSEHSPWQWHRPHGSDVRYLVDSKGNTVVRDDPDEPLSDERARLIAAAPELFQLLKLAEEYAEWPGAAIARKLIARIEGESTASKNPPAAPASASEDV